MEISPQVEHPWLLVRSCPGAPIVKVSIKSGDELLHEFDIPFAENRSDGWWASVNLSAQLGEKISIACESDALLKTIRFSDHLPDQEMDYLEPLRPQFHFSARRGWLNDPNGLVFFNGLYHLFFQHNPYGTEWGNMHWGHAVSEDLFQWRELDIALYPDALGAMFSGSAVVDRTSTPPRLALLYTAAKHPDVQCLAYSTDGLTFEKFAANPVLDGTIPGCRDPKVIWHEATRKWIMVLYAPDTTESADPAQVRYTVRILSSNDLIDWRFESVVPGGKGSDRYLFECPDFFPLPDPGAGGAEKWVLIGANGGYQIGAFDGHEFKPETKPLRGVVGDVFYAGQTFSDEPNNRRIMIGWLRAPSPAMPFSQCMSAPLELSLVSTAEGSRLRVWPAEEIESIEGETMMELAAGLNDMGRLSSHELELFDCEVEVETSAKATFALAIRGIVLVYHAAERVLVWGERRIRIPAEKDGVSFRVIVDRTTVEIFAAGGLVYFPIAAILPPDEEMLAVIALSGLTTVRSMKVRHLNGD